MWTNPVWRSGVCWTTLSKSPLSRSCLQLIPRTSTACSHRRYPQANARTSPDCRCTELECVPCANLNPPAELSKTRREVFSIQAWTPPKSSGRTSGDGDRTCRCLLARSRLVDGIRDQSLQRPADGQALRRSPKSCSSTKCFPASCRACRSF